jgi:phenylalanine-4-hydroxylase
MAVGESVISAFHGPADVNSFDLVTHKITESTIKSQKSAERLRLEKLYQRIRDYRENIDTTISRAKVFEELKKKYPNDWLLSIEIYELARKSNRKELAEAIVAHLSQMKLSQPKLGHLIDDGLMLVDKELENAAH